MIKVVILQRIILPARFPLFDRLGKKENINLKIIHGPDFQGTKLIGSKKKGYYQSESLYSLLIKGKSGNGDFFMTYSPFLFFKLIVENPNVIISEGTSNLINALQGFIYAKIFRKKFIWFSLGGLQNREYKGMRAKIDHLIQYIEKKCNAILTYSNYGKSVFVQRNIPENKIFVSVNVIDTEARQKEIAHFDKATLIKKEEGKIRLLFVGALDKVKRVDLLIELMELLKVKYPSIFELYIVGGGVCEGELKNMIAEKSLTNEVIMAGKVYEGINKYFLSSDLFILPGLGGLAISDSLVHSLPVIASIADGVEKDLIINGENGYLFDHEMDLHELFDKVSELYESNAIPNLKHNASNIIKKYNMTNYVNQVYSAIQYVLRS